MKMAQVHSKDYRNRTHPELHSLPQYGHIHVLVLFCYSIDN